MRGLFYVELEGELRLKTDKGRVLSKGNELATPMGFEPTISSVTGWRVEPLHYGASRITRKIVSIFYLRRQAH